MEKTGSYVRTVPTTRKRDGIKGRMAGSIQKRWREGRLTKECQQREKKTAKKAGEVRFKNVGGARRGLTECQQRKKKDSKKAEGKKNEGIAMAGSIQRRWGCEGRLTKECQQREKKTAKKAEWQIRIKNAGA